MKIAKWLIALMAVMVFVGCEQSDEQKLEAAQKDAEKAAAEMQKDAEKALDGVKVPSLK